MKNEEFGFKEANQLYERARKDAEKHCKESEINLKEVKSMKEIESMQKEYENYKKTELESIGFNPKELEEKYKKALTGK